MKKKVCLALASLIISVVLVEVFLRISVDQIQSTHTLLPKNKESDFQATFRGSRYDDIYENYSKSTHSPYHIVAVGDSFTNGGNVYRSHSYPSLLFEQLEDQYPVTNLGLCESTTQDTFLRVQKFIEESKSNKTFIFLILVGAADLFIDQSFFTQKRYRDYLNSLKHADLTKLPGPHQEGQFKVAALIKAAFNSAKKEFNIYERYQLNDQIYNHLKSCYQNENIRTKCLKDYFSNINWDDLNVDEQKQIHSLIHYFNQRKAHVKSYSKGLEDYFLLIQSAPLSLMSINLAYTIAAHTRLQSQITLETSLKIIKDVYIKNKEEIEKRRTHRQVDSYSDLFKALERAVKEKNKVEFNRQEYLEKLASLIKEEGHLSIFLNYPISYSKINKDLENLAQKKQLDFINLHDIFEKQKGRHLIDDWEHCTPQGYELMAKIIAQRLKSSILKKTSMPLK